MHAARPRERRKKLGAVFGALAFAVVMGSVTFIPTGQAAFPGLNGKIAFASDRDGQYEIYVMSADGTNPIRLTNSLGSDIQLNWSPDGTRIAFISNRTGQYEIYVMNADGTGVTQLTNNTVPDGTAWPSWSPDGTKIAFQSQTNFANDIYVMNADGTGVTQLTNSPGVDYVPDWQPLHYTFSGFFQPVDNPGPGPSVVFNVAKAGSAVPVKFSLNGDHGLSIFASGYPKSERITCNASASLDGIEETVTAGSSSLSYDATTDQYTYVWKTDKAWASTCRKLTVRLNDGTDHIAYFNFKK